MVYIEHENYNVFTHYRNLQNVRSFYFFVPLYDIHYILSRHIVPQYISLPDDNCIETLHQRNPDQSFLKCLLYNELELDVSLLYSLYLPFPIL